MDNKTIAQQNQKNKEDKEEDDAVRGYSRGLAVIEFFFSPFLFFVDTIQFFVKIFK